MKKVTNILLCGVLAISAVMPLCGCTSTRANESQVEEYDVFLWNDGDRSLNISYMNMEERKALVKNYLDYIGFNCEGYELGEVYQKSNGNFSAESAYSCNVYKVNEDSFTVWLENDGKAIDDRFMDELNPLIQDYVVENLTAVYPESRASVSAGMQRKPLKVWTAAEGAEKFLKSNEDYVMYLYVVLDADSTLTQTEAEAEMHNRLGFLNDAEFFFFKEENPEAVNPEELSWTDADFSFTQNRE